MNTSIEIKITAIISGIDETVMCNLRVGNKYKIIEESLTNEMIWKRFVYTALGLRMIYEQSKLNDKLKIALLTKKISLSYENPNNDEGDKIRKIQREEINYLDNKMRAARIFKENGIHIKEILIESIINKKFDNTKREVLRYERRDKIPLFNISGNVEKLTLKDEKEIKKLNRFIKNFDLSFNGNKFDNKILIRASCLYDESYISTVDTLQFMVCVIGLESLLVDGKSEITYKFSRNYAMLISKNKEEYEEYKITAKNIYKKRSEYVHNGMIKKLTLQDICEARQMLRKTIFAILRINKSKEEIMRLLDLKGYK